MKDENPPSSFHPSSLSLHPFSTRLRQPEWMDEDDADEKSLIDSLRFIRRVNAFFGYTRATLGHLERFSRNWHPGQRITILDLATGSADIPRAMLNWATRRGFDLHITAVDRHPVTTRAAQDGNTDPRLSILQADVFNLPFEPASFDYVTTAMFLHHLDDDQIVTVMRNMDRLARKGVIIADLLRSRRAYAWIRFFTLFSTPMVKHDAAVSVMQAFTRGEIEHLRDQAGLGYAKYHHHFGHRFVLSGERD